MCSYSPVTANTSVENIRQIVFSSRLCLACLIHVLLILLIASSKTKYPGRGVFTRQRLWKPSLRHILHLLKINQGLIRCNVSNNLQPIPDKLTTTAIGYFMKTFLKAPRSRSRKSKRLQTKALINNRKVGAGRDQYPLRFGDFRLHPAASDGSHLRRHTRRVDREFIAPSWSGESCVLNGSERQNPTFWEGSPCCSKKCSFWY